MSNSFNSRGDARTFAWCFGALAAVSLDISCAGPSSRAERISTATEALDAPAPAALSAEFDLDHSSVIERPTNCPQVVFGTTSYLVTHTDPVQPQMPLSWGQLAVTRLDRSGNKLQAFDIPGAFVSSSNRCAPVVFAGGAFITLWPAEDGTLWCTRFAEDGTLLNAGGASTGLASVGVDSATLDGSSNKLLVSMTDGKVALVGVDCSAITTPIALPAKAGATRWPSGAAFDGSQYWVAYSETLNGSADRFLLQAVSPTGAPSGMPVTVATAPWVRTANSPTYRPGAQGSIAAGGGKTALGYSIVVKDNPYLLPNVDAHYAELSSAGALSKDTSLNASNSIVPATIKIGFTGGGFSLAWPGGWIVKVLDDGTTVQSIGGIGVGEPATVSFDGDGTNVLLAVEGQLVNARSSITQLFTAGSSPGQANNLQQMSVRHEATVVASGAQSSLTVWIGPDRSFLGSRISSDATILDGAPLEIHPYSSLERITRPVVAASATNFLVGWSESSVGTGPTVRVDAALVSGSGEVSPSFVVAQATVPENTYFEPFLPVVASDGSDYLMLWDHGGSLEAARVTSNRQVLDQPPLVLQSAPGKSYSEVAVAYDGAQYVVVSRALPPPQPGVPLTVPFVVQRVSKAGAKTLPVETPWQASAGIVPNPPAITWGADQGLVAFAQGAKLFVGRLSAALEPLDDPGILVTDHFNGFKSIWNGGLVSLAWDGTNYWVSWKDSRRVESDDFYVARVSREGSLLDPLGVALSLSVATPHLTWPGGVYGGFANCMLASAQGHVLAAYTRFDPAPDVYNFVQHGRWLSSGTTTGGNGGAGGTNGGAGGTNGGAGGTNAGDVGASGGNVAANGGVGGTNGGDVGASGGVSGTSGGVGGTSGGDVGTSGGNVGANGGAGGTNGGDVGMSGGVGGTSGGVGGTSGGTASADAGTGGLSVEDAGSAGSAAEAGSSGFGSPSDDGGASGSVATNGGKGATGGAATTSGGATTTAGDAPTTPGPDAPHSSGCSVGTHRENTKRSLFWLTVIALPLLRRARRPKAA